MGFIAEPGMLDPDKMTPYELAEKAVEMYGRLVEKYMALFKVAEKIVDNDDRLDNQVAIHNSNKAREKAIDELRDLIRRPKPTGGGV